MEKRHDYPLEEILGRYTEDQLRALFANLTSVELADRCSLMCPWCGVRDEKRAKKDYMSVMTLGQIKGILKRFGKEMKNAWTALYFATDPLDWEDGSANYRDISALFEKEAGYKPCLYTSVPVGKEELAHQLLIDGKVDKISISPINFQRLKRMFLEKYPQLEDPEQSFEIAMENGRKTVRFVDKPWDRDYTGFNWIVLVWRLQKETSPGRTEAFTLADENGNFEERKSYVLGAENIGRLSARGIVCGYGVILRADGFHNIIEVKPSEEHPMGFYTEPISPEHFDPVSQWTTTKTYYLTYLDYMTYKKKDLGKWVAMIPIITDEPDPRAVRDRKFSKPEFFSPARVSEVRISNRREILVLQDLLRLCTLLSQPWISEPELAETREVYETSLAFNLFNLSSKIIHNPAYSGDAYLEKVRTAVTGFLEAGRINSGIARGFLKGVYTAPTG